MDLPISTTPVARARFLGGLLGCLCCQYALVQFKSVRQDSINVKPRRCLKYLYASDFSVFCRIEIDSFSNFDNPVRFLVAKT